MKYSERLPAHRAALFAQIGEAIRQGERFPELFASVAAVAHPAFRPPLLKLRESIVARPDVPLAAHLDAAPLLLAWETRLLRLGLATLRIPEICARICDYYVVLERSTRALSYLLLVLLSVLWLGLGALLFTLWTRHLGWDDGTLRLLGPASIGVSLVGSGVGAAFLSGVLLTQWSAPDSRLWRLLGGFRMGRSCLVARSLYQYLLNLGLCVQCGFDIQRSVRLCAGAEAVPWIRQRYLAIDEALRGGGSLSAAFLGSGLLGMTRIETLPTRTASGAAQPLWSAGITDVVKSAFQQQLWPLFRIVAAALSILTLAGLFAILLSAGF